MLRKTFAIILSATLLSVALGFKSVEAKTVEASQLAEKARIEVAKMGTGERARVEVKMRDNTKLKGYISNVGDEAFTVTDRKTGASQHVAYTDVQQVKKQGGGLRTRTWVVLGASAAAAVVTWIIVKPALCDGGAQTRGIC
ncbi:MAG TPA: hypothetical protein VF666_15610 [Pyrinomonadaceae bacterium]